LGAITPFIFAKIATVLAFSNSPNFHFSKYVKMAKNCIKALLEIKRRAVAGSSVGSYLQVGA